MPNSEGKKLYQLMWFKVVSGVAAFGILGTLGTATVTVVNHWEFWDSLPSRLGNISDSVAKLYDGDAVFEDYLEKKTQSFAVGFRVKKTTDEHTGKTRWIKQYRDWKGNLNDIYLDKEYSEMYGIEYYFYYDKDTGDKKYCW